VPPCQLHCDNTGQHVRPAGERNGHTLRICDEHTVSHYPRLPDSYFYLHACLLSAAYRYYTCLSSAAYRYTATSTYTYTAAATAYAYATTSTASYGECRQLCLHSQLQQLLSLLRHPEHQ
jgi:hypothetical protein